MYKHICICVSLYIMACKHTKHGNGNKTQNKTSRFVLKWFVSPRR